MGELVLRGLYFSLLFNEHHLRPLLYHFLRLLHLLHHLLHWFLRWFLNWFLLYCSLGVGVKSVGDAELDDICEFLDVQHVEAGDCLIAVLLLDVFPDVGFEVREEVGVDFVVAEVEDVLDGLLHLGHVERLEGFVLDALDVELVVDLFLDVAAVGLEVDQQSFPRLLVLVHQYNYFNQPQKPDIHRRGSLAVDSRGLRVCI